MVLAKAYVLISCESGSEDYLVSSLKSLPSVSLAVGVFGTYDLLTRLEANTQDNLSEVVTKKIRKMPRIRATYTLMTDEKNNFPGKTIDGKEILDQYMSQAYVLMEYDRNFEKQVIENLQAIPEVIDGDILLNTNQIICNVMGPTYNDISDIVTKKIRKIPHIKGTNTLNVVGNRSK